MKYEEVLDICLAYEQGVGKGRRDSNDDNPYTKGDSMHMAWNYGYAEGLIWFRDNEK